ncbi:MAG: hypothetical protein OCC49_04245 [Fibrobacterales bacterium]
MPLIRKVIVLSLISLLLMYCSDDSSPTSTPPEPTGNLSVVIVTPNDSLYSLFKPLFRNIKVHLKGAGVDTTITLPYTDSLISLTELPSKRLKLSFSIQDMSTTLFTAKDTVIITPETTTSSSITPTYNPAIQFSISTPQPYDSLTHQQISIVGSLIHTNEIDSFNLNSTPIKMGISDKWSLVTILETGDNSLVFTIKDTEGNYLYHTLPVHLIDSLKDSKPPIINITSTKDSAVYLSADSIIIQGIASDESGIASVIVNSDTVLFEFGKWEYPFIPEEPGEQHAIITATDLNGYSSTDSVIFYYHPPFLDSIAPLIWIDSITPIDTLFTTNPTITIHALDNGSLAYIALNDSILPPAEDSTYHYTLSLLEGPNTIILTAEDYEYPPNTSTEIYSIYYKDTSNTPITESPRYPDLVFTEVDGFYEAKVAGWTLYFSPAMRNLQKGEHVYYKLIEDLIYLNQTLPRTALTIAQQTNFWIDSSSSTPDWSFYKEQQWLIDNGLPTKWHKGIHIADAESFIALDTNPSITTHLLAQSFFDRRHGSENSIMREAFNSARNSNLYTITPPTTDEEYFALLSQYYWCNDDAFTTDSLKELDPFGVVIMEVLWTIDE